MDPEKLDPKEQRRSLRHALEAEVGIRRSGAQGFRTQVYDASPEGCRIEFVELPSIGERVWVRFDGLQSLEGTVRWVHGHKGGVQFERPLYEAVFQRLAAQAKSLNQDLAQKPRL